MTTSKPRSGYKLVKTIYQQHEEIPNDWNFVSILDTGKIVGGGTPKTENSKYWEGGSIQWFTPEELTKLETNFVKESKRKITQKGLDESSAKIIPENNILITTRATIGNCAINERKSTTNQGFQNLIVNKNHNNKFLMYSIRNNKNRLRQYSQGTTFLEISKTNFERIKIPCPKNNVKEEEKIASILSNIDELILKQKQVIHQTQKLMKGQMQQLLTKGIGHTKFKKVQWLFKKEIEIPEEWDWPQLLDNSILKGRIGWQGLTSAEYRDEGKFFLVTGTDFKDGRINWETCVYVDEERYSQDPYIQLKKDDVLITKDGTIGKIAYVDTVNLPTTLNTGVFVVRPIEKKYLPLFLYYILHSDYFIKFITRIKAGSTINHLYQKDFMFFHFPVPSTIVEQQKITSILSNLDYLIQQEKQYKEKLERIKKGLLQLLLTGRKRVKV